MRPDLITDLYEKERDYWWHVCKREMVLSILENVGFEKSPTGTRIGVDIGCGTGYTAKVLDSHWRRVGDAERRQFIRAYQIQKKGVVDSTTPFLNKTNL